MNQQTSEYEYRVEAQPDFSFLTVKLQPEQTLKVEGSAMATMDTNLRMKTKMRGGFKRFLTGESIFINEFTAQNGPGEIGIAPGAPGDLDHVYLENDTIYLQNTAYVASSPAVNIETKWQGFMKGFFSGESLFLIKCSGQGDVWFNTFGGMIVIDVDGSYVVDTGHIVGFDPTITFDVRRVGGWKSTILSGEGLVCNLTGPGRILMQTRSEEAFLQWLIPKLPKQTSPSRSSDD